MSFPINTITWVCYCVQLRILCSTIYIIKADLNFYVFNSLLDSHELFYIRSTSRQKRRLVAVKMTFWESKPWTQNRDQPEVPLSWKPIPISSMRMSENTPFWRHIDAILASSPGTFDLKATFSGYESWRFVLKYEKAGGQNCRGNLPGWRIDGDDEMREATCARTSTSKVPTESRTSG